MKKNSSQVILILFVIYSSIYFSLNLKETIVDSDISGNKDTPILEIGGLHDVGIKQNLDNESGQSKQGHASTPKIQALESQVEVNSDVLKTSETTVQQEYFTIQIFSSKSLEKAVVAYERIEKILGEVQIGLDFLRIENVKDFYTIRIGKYENRQSAVQLLKNIREHFIDSLMLSAYIKPERIEKIYQINDLPTGSYGLDMR